ncbi:hypothetical protein RI129_007292 [Pyrocoelia pectoralis]|uniref:Uncharacterized protein n=1 Tax=Pyrocoelia pectoralis TaxID=417401 RepID=A0AAN7ZIE2_9COLE
MEKWHPYLGHYEQYISPYQFARNPKEELKKILTKVRFQAMNLTIEPRPLKLPLSYCPGHFVSHVIMEIPTDLRIEFGLSCLDAIRELNFNSFDENNEEQFDYYFDTLVGHVTKPM